MDRVITEIKLAAVLQCTIKYNTANIEYLKNKDDIHRAEQMIALNCQQSSYNADIMSLLYIFLSITTYKFQLKVSL